MNRTTTMVALAGLLAGSMFLASPQSAGAAQQTWRTPGASAREAAPLRVERRMNRRMERRMDRRFDRRADRRMDWRADRRFDRRSDRRFERRFERRAGRQGIRARSYDAHRGFRIHARAACPRARFHDSRQFRR